MLPDQSLTLQCRLIKEVQMFTQNSLIIKMKMGAPSYGVPLVQW